MTKALNKFALDIIHNDRLIQRSIDELLGLCKGAALDGGIAQIEAEGIYAWLKANRHCLETWPASTLFDRLHDMLSDGVLDADEEKELLGLVMQIANPLIHDNRHSSALPIDLPPPAVTVPGHSFCFTGVFDFGSRAACHAAINDRGGIAVNSITKKLHYLVIGNIGSDHWKHSSFGNKIIKAVEYREAGSPLILVDESHWTEALP